MAALPYMQFYVADYLADTTHLTAEEHGAYMLLLFSYWQTGKPLRIDRLSTVARIPSDRWPSVADTLSEFFHVTPTHWVQFRVEADLEAVNSKVVTASNAGKASAKAKALKKQRESNDRSTTVDDSLQLKTNHIDTDKNREKNTLPARDEPVDPVAAVNPKLPVEMELTWQPDQKILKTYALHAGLALELFTPDVLAAFTLHHEPSGVMNTQAKWVSMLVRWVQGDKAKGSNVRAFPKPQTSRHHGFAERDYTAGLTLREDGTYAF